MCEMGEQMSLLDLDICCGRMSPEHSLPTKEKTSEESLKKQPKLSTKMPLYLCLRKINGVRVDASWEMGGALLGEYAMHSFGESPKEEIESHLLQILEENPHPKYSLSARACKGILTRAERRGKELPPHSQDGFGIQNCNGGVKTYDARGNGDGEICCTITGDHENRVTDYTALVAYGFDPGATRDVGTLFLEGKAKTLAPGTCPGHHDGVVICMDRSAYNQGKNAKFNIGIDENGIAFSCIAKGLGAVCYIDTSHADDVVRMDDVVAPLQARDYKGGKYVMAVDCRNGPEDECNNSLQSVAAHSLNGNNVVRIGFEVRRLTPLECERLQGYPDYWTDIGEYTNSKGKNKKVSDAERYKALGNSIALPSWKWILKKLCACYERDATMASLFDGIGGFPYLWEQINGKGSCLWASEKEDFPIAVTKVRL